MKLKRKRNRDIFTSTCSSIINGVISFIIFLLVLVFPLIYNNAYFDILVTKYRFYWVCVVAMLVLCFILSLIMMVIDIMEYNGRHAKALFSRLLPKNGKKHFVYQIFRHWCFGEFWLFQLYSQIMFMRRFGGTRGVFPDCFLCLYI